MVGEAQNGRKTERKVGRDRGRQGGSEAEGRNEEGVRGQTGKPVGKKSKKTVIIFIKVKNKKRNLSEIVHIFLVYFL